LRSSGLAMAAFRRSQSRRHDGCLDRTWRACLPTRGSDTRSCCARALQWIPQPFRATPTCDVSRLPPAQTEPLNYRYCSSPLWSPTTFDRSSYGRDDACDVLRSEHSDGPLEARAAARFHNPRSVLRSAGELVNITSTHCCSKVRCLFWTAVRATSSCAPQTFSLSKHARISALACLDYNVGVPNLTRVSVFPSR
jgi:hypothetical protein